MMCQMYAFELLSSECLQVCAIFVSVCLSDAVYESLEHVIPCVLRHSRDDIFVKIQSLQVCIYPSDFDIYIAVDVFGAC